MKDINGVIPHGGELIDLRVDEERAHLLKEITLNLPDITLNERQMCDLELLAYGAFSPLKGFMTRSDYESVLDRMRLQNGVLWPIPICLDVSGLRARKFEAGQSVALRDPEGYLLAVMHIEDIWPVEREKEARLVYGTLDQSHPGTEYLFKTSGDYYFGGHLEVISPPLHSDFKQFRMTPAEIRSNFNKYGWKRMAAFLTRNPIHRPQFEMTINAMREANANLLLLPIAGISKPGDFDHYTRVRCYRRVVEHYPPDTFMLNLLPLAMRMSGPREALLHAIVAKNYGCTHFIAGRDHAGPGKDCNGTPYYRSDEACRLTEQHSQEIGITVMPFTEMVYLPFEDQFRCADQVPEGTQFISLSGTDTGLGYIPGGDSGTAKSVSASAKAGIYGFSDRPFRRRQIHRCQSALCPFPGNRGSTGNAAGRGHRAAQPFQRADLFKRAPGYQRSAHRICGQRDHQKPRHRRLRADCTLCLDPQRNTQSHRSLRRFYRGACFHTH
jgi:sulfate adenylyltransferase